MLLDVVIIAFLMIIAIVLMLAEIFLFPGITLAGIGGAIFAFGGIFFAYSIGALLGHWTLILSLIAFGIAFAWSLRSRSFNKLALNTDIDSRLISSKELGIKPGDEGVTLSRLAPIGKAKINDIVVEAKSQEELIDENTPIIVVKVESCNIIVRPK